MNPLFGSERRQVNADVVQLEQVSVLDFMNAEPAWQGAFGSHEVLPVSSSWILSSMTLNW